MINQTIARNEIARNENCSTVSSREAEVAREYRLERDALQATLRKALAQIRRDTATIRRLKCGIETLARGAR